MTAMLTAVPFRDDTLLASRADDGEVLVAVKPICVALGLAWHGQWERIKRDAVLSATIRVIRTVAQDGKNRDVFCLPLRFLNGWLFGVDENRVRAEIRDKVIAYKRECYDVLWRHFHPTAGLALAANDAAATAPTEDDDDADTLASMPHREMRAWIDLVREARLLGGRRAAMAIWDSSPLPPLPGYRAAPDAPADAANAPALFASEALAAAPGQYLTFAAIYRAYTRWCTDQRESPLTKIHFGRQMRAAGYVTKVGGGGGMRFVDVAWV